MAAAKKTAPKKIARKKKPAARQTRPAAKKSGARPKTAAVPRAKRSTARRKSGSGALGRFRIPAAARLDLVFQKDYQAREIFDFLRIQTVAELEHFGPEEIIERLTGPMVQTVQRIRKTLALANRHLSKDERFAKAFLAEVKRTQN